MQLADFGELLCPTLAGCVELNSDSEEKPSPHGSVKALFRAISTAVENEAPVPAEADIEMGGDGGGRRGFGRFRFGLRG